MDASGDGINEFLQRIRELGDKRDREDNERARKLEEEIIAGREARRARRDERARSLSPQKDSPVGTPISLRSVVDSRPGTREGEETSAKNGDPYDETLEKLSGKLSAITTDTPEAMPRQQETSHKPTLSWQRRPKSMVSISPSSKPSSLLHKQDDNSQDEEEPKKRRSQIALNLSSKDPSWFRQTADRGTTSGALRKSQEDSMESSSKMALPGMSDISALAEKFERGREITPEPEKAAPISSRSTEEPLSTAGFMSRRDSLRSLDRNSLSSSTSGLGPHQRHRSMTTGGSLRLDQHLFGGGSGSIDFSRPPGMGPTQGRISPERSERSVSPTKGFVQSALLRREGSINKRWSNSHQTGSLSRNGSTASTSQNHQRDTNDEDTITRSRAASIAGSVSKHSPAGTVLSDNPNLDADDDHGTPTSPTKFDQKRWSRTKSSWLEAALKKGTESPQPTPPAKPVGKLQDLPQLKPVVTSKPSETIGISSRPPINPKPLNISTKPSASTPSTPSTSIKPITVGKTTPTPPTPKPALEEKPGTFVKPALTSSSMNKSTVFDKANFPTRPLHGSKGSFDLRAQLKSRQPVGNSTEKEEELPFLSAISKLKATRTQNFVPPNELKDRILVGKADLRSTGGPQKNNSPDPLKERLISAKVALRHSPSNSVSGSPTEALRPKSQPSEFPPKITPPVKLEPGKLDLGKKGSSFADRFNPNLASLLQRGPPPAAAAKSSGSTHSNGRTFSDGKSEKAEAPEQPSGQLTHMTKGRVRGPKRRSPTKPERPNVEPAAAATLSLPQSRTPTKEKHLPSVKRTPSPRPAEIPRKPSLVLAPPKMADIETLSPSAEPSSLQLTPQKSDKLKPPTPAKSPLLRADSYSNLREKAQTQSTPGSPATEKSVSMSLAEVSPYSSRAVSRASSRENISPSLSASETSREIQLLSKPVVEEKAKDEEPAISVKQAAASCGQLIEDSKPSRSPIWAPPKNEEITSMEYFGLPAPPSQPKVIQPVTTTLPPLLNPASTKSELDSSQILASFFHAPPNKVPRVEIDIMTILSSNPILKSEKVKTVKCEVFELTGSGKHQAVPSEKQHVLFDENMYICIHGFEDELGNRGTEVYHWTGDKVPEAAAEDAQLFVRKVARENEGKLIRLRQGRETPIFFQAIGGILITRRGSRSKLSIDNTFMLCGRSCSGGVAFDEVEVQASSLCSGFPFIISSKGKTFLWKGKGSTARELGVARLVAVEISGGEVEEVEEAKEPESFFDHLGGGDKAGASAHYWHLKPSNKYFTRLFKMDLRSQTRVVEISPFCQSDLDPAEIYVIDAFFELYIVLGAKSQAKRAEFQLALQFSQEYAILAVSQDDRPFIPVSSVIVGGAPREFKVLFRNWEDARISTNWQPSRKPSLRVVGLSTAMEAMNVTE